jgi:hypothetical protein
MIYGRALPLHGWFALAAAALGACRSSTEPVVRGPSLRFVAGANATDTVRAILTQALVVEVRDSSGAPAPFGTVVRFSSVQVPSRPYEALVEGLTSTFFSTFATGTTDQAGRTAVLVQLGYVAGPARIAVSVPTLNLLDTARFTVAAGAAFAVAVAPGDTTLMIGKSFTLRGGVVDMWGNPRSDPVTWSVTGAGISVTSAGVVTASAVGRYTITATSSLGSGSGFVSVVPQGRLAAATAPYASGNVVTADLDGANRASVATVNDAGIGVHPAWIPGTSTIVYTSYVNELQTLYKVGADGVAVPFFATRPANVSHEAEPTPSADGRWLYFSAYDTRCTVNAYCLYRAKIDGSAPELLSSYISTTSATWRPAPSPDGSRVAFMIGDPYGGGTIKVFDVATRMASSWGVPGESPAWSPDGTRIAYLSGNGTIALIDPDGTGARTLTPPGIFFSRPISWSPDSKWLVAPAQGKLHLIDAATGADLPLAWTTGLYAGSLK